MKKVLAFNTIKKELTKVEVFLSQYVNFSHDQLKDSAQHILQAGGKRIRPAFVLLSGSFYNKRGEYDLIPLAAAVELIHMASLVHDDVIDKADTRRGKPTIREIWGNKFSLHCGDFLFAQAIKLIKPIENKRIANILAEISVDMCQGEIQQLITTFDTGQTVKDYFYRIKRKTALLIAASCEIGAVATNAPSKSIDALKKYGYYLGMAFQIKDDVLDIQGSSNIIGKPAGSDLAQGIITLPTIFALQKNNQDSLKLKNLISSRFTNGPDVLKEALAIINKTGAVNKSLLVSQKYIVKAKEQLCFLPDCPTKNALKEIADYINERDF
ncbi:MAG: polyprenyl synthetase family protein [Bacillota bacterium]